ncbi:MAG: sodium:calcium antiporter [Geminicoccaceae bacterium]|nr:MAG: sodium:calcium antiporter [Geminicoccaceae bacterium]
MALLDLLDTVSHALANLAAARPALIWPLVLAVALACLVKSADVFTAAAERVGVRAGLSPFVVGILIVSVGTSLPELVAAIFAVLRGASEMVVANVAGSNIANLGLVLGLAAVMGGTVQIRRRLTHVDLPFLAGSTLLLALMAWSGQVVALEGVILLLGLALYLHFGLHPPAHVESTPSPSSAVPGPLWRALLGLLFGAGVLLVAADLTVVAVLEIADLFGIATETLAATVIALGTSLPELVVTVVAARKGQAEMAVGNVVGSSVFNAFAVTGVAALVGPLAVPPSLIGLALPLMVGITALTIVMLHENSMSRWEGSLLLLVYAYFLLAITGLVA